MKRFQQGAALVVGLMLLTILTLLATSTMNTAATELLLSGNDQYQLRAAQAADTGIEQTLVNGAFTGADATLTATLPGGDSYTAVIHPRNTTPAPRGFNKTFIAEHYEIESTGRSHRGARVTRIQGLFVVRALMGAPDTPDTPRCVTGIEIRPQRCKEPGAVIRTYWKSMM